MKITDTKFHPNDEVWQPIETAPKDGSRIIVYRPVTNAYIPHVGEDWFSSRLGKVWAKSNNQHQPTHWMPLPSPPSGSGSDRPTPTGKYANIGNHLEMNNSDTPESQTDSGVKPDGPQNTFNNSVSSTDGDLDHNKL